MSCILTSNDELILLFSEFRVDSASYITLSRQIISCQILKYTYQLYNVIMYMLIVTYCLLYIV